MNTQLAAIASLLIAPAVTGCGSRDKAAPTETRTTISLVGWGAPEERVILRDAIARFEQQNPTIRVEYTQVPGVGYDYLNKVRLRIVARMAPDVFYVPDGAFGEIVRHGLLLNMDTFVASSSVVRLEDMWPSAVDRYRWNGRTLHEGSLYALPKDIGPMALYYNKDVLKSRGVPPPDPSTPMTWDEAIAVWKELSFREGYVQHYGIAGYPYEAAVWSAGAEIVDAERLTWVLDSREAAAAVQWCADLALRHGVAPNPAHADANAGELFEAGRAAMHIHGRWMGPRYRELSFDWDIAPIPVPRAGMPSISASGSVGLGISASSKYPAEAFKLIEYLAGPEGQGQLTRTGLQVPNQRWLSATDVFLQPGQRPEHAEVFLRSAETSRPGPWTATPNVFWHDVFSTFIDQVWRGDRSAHEALSAMAPLVNQTLRENNEE
jgi:multiple sugar transport system substrate-binding protein